MIIIIIIGGRSQLLTCGKPICALSSKGSQGAMLIPITPRAAILLPRSAVQSALSDCFKQSSMAEFGSDRILFDLSNLAVLHRKSWFEGWKTYEILQGISGKNSHCISIQTPLENSFLDTVLLRPSKQGSNKPWETILQSFQLWIVHVEVSINEGPNGWFIRENPIQMDDLGVPPSMETPMWNTCTPTGLFILALQGYPITISASSLIHFEWSLAW